MYKDKYCKEIERRVMDVSVSSVTAQILTADSEKSTLAN